MLKSPIEFICGAGRECLHEKSKYLPCDSSGLTARMKEFPRDWPPEEMPSECPHCSEAFSPDRVPVPVAMEKDLTSEYGSLSNKYNIFGIFCRPACALGYLHERSQGLDSRSWSLTICMLHECFGVPLECLKPALPRIVLKKCGGTLDLRESTDASIFYNDDHFENVKILKKPFVSLPMIMEIHAATSTSTSKSTDDEPTISTTTTSSTSTSSTSTSSTSTSSTTPSTLGALEDHWLPKSEMFDFIKSKLPSTSSSYVLAITTSSTSSSTSNTTSASAAAAGSSSTSGKTARRRKAPSSTTTSSSSASTTSSSESITCSTSTTGLLAFKRLSAEVEDD